RSEGNGTIGVDDHVTGGVCRRSPAKIGQIRFRRQVTDRSIKRHLVVVTTEIGIDLGFAVANGIDRHPKTRSPVINKGMAGHGTLHAVLLPAEAEIESDEAIDRPRVVAVGSDVASGAKRGAYAEFPAVLLEVNPTSHAIGCGVQRADGAVSTDAQAQ